MNSRQKKMENPERINELKTNTATEVRKREAKKVHLHI